MTATRMSVWCSLQFEGLHYWPSAPSKVSFLRHPHRHLFHVRVEVSVQHSDRDVEFILMRRHVQDLVAGFDPMEPKQWSCEVWAHVIGDALISEGYAVQEIEVSEDGENGARLRYLR